MLLADFKKNIPIGKGKRGNWQGNNYPSENYRKDSKSKDPSMNLYDPAGYGTGSYGYYPSYQRKTTTQYKRGGDGMMVYDTSGYGGHNNIGLGGYSTESFNNDVMKHGDYRGLTLPHYRTDSYAKEDTVPRKGDMHRNGIQQWLRGKESKVIEYSKRYQDMMQQSK